MNPVSTSDSIKSLDLPKTKKELLMDSRGSYLDRQRTSRTADLCILSHQRELGLYQVHDTDIQSQVVPRLLFSEQDEQCSENQANYDVHITVIVDYEK